MADPESKPDKTLADILDRPFTKPPEGEDGMGPTLGEDVSVEHEREVDRRHDAHSEDQGPGI